MTMTHFGIGPTSPYSPKDLSLWASRALRAARLAIGSGVDQAITTLEGVRLEVFRGEQLIEGLPVQSNEVCVAIPWSLDLDHITALERAGLDVSYAQANRPVEITAPLYDGALLWGRTA